MGLLSRSKFHAQTVNQSVLFFAILNKNLFFYFAEISFQVKKANFYHYVFLLGTF